MTVFILAYVLNCFLSYLRGGQAATPA